MKLWKHGKDDLNGDLAFYAVIAKRRDSENSEACRAVLCMVALLVAVSVCLPLSHSHHCIPNHYQCHTQ